MNFLDLKTALMRYGFDSTDPLAAWINEGYHEVETAHTWPWLIQSSVFTTLSLNALGFITNVPSNFSKPLGVYYQGNKLDETNIRDVSPADRSAQGTPYGYFTLNNLIGIYPMPVVYTPGDLYMDYIIKLDDLVNDADVPAMPSGLHYSIVRGAAYVALQAENEEERAANAFGEFERRVEQQWTRDAPSSEGSMNYVRNTANY